MSRIAQGLAVGLTLAGWSLLGPAAHAAPRSCDSVTGDIAAARQAGDLGKLAALWSEAKALATGCTEQALYCLGQSIALGYVEAGYKKGDAGEGPESIEPVLAAGLAYGSPWQLRVGLGDIRLARARAAHDAALFSAAAFDYQEALIAIGEPPVCAVYGEAPRPAAADIATIYAHLSTALLLAKPVKVATTKCAPCQWLFLSGIAGFTPATRSLPITFAEGASRPTPEGADAIAAFLDCLKAGGYSRIVLSGHTDAIGSAEYNRGLSARRLKVVRRMLVDGGFAGEIVLEPKGKEEPFLDDGGGYSPTEIRRLNRRIEFREGKAKGHETCT